MVFIEQVFDQNILSIIFISSETMETFLDESESPLDDKSKDLDIEVSLLHDVPELKYIPTDVEESKLTICIFRI